MIGNDTSAVLQSTAWVLGGIALVIFVISVASKLRKLSLDIHGVKVSLDTEVVPASKKIEQISKDTSDISQATNHKLPHELPMVKRIGILEAGQVAILGSLEAHRRDTKIWQQTIVEKLGIEVRIARDEQPPREPNSREGDK